MAESWETLSHHGLIYRIVHEVAEIEGKRTGGHWAATDRNYVLDLIRDTVQAIEGIRGQSPVQGPGQSPRR